MLERAERIDDGYLFCEGEVLVERILLDLAQQHRLHVDDASGNRLKAEDVPAGPQPPLAKDKLLVECDADGLEQLSVPD